MNHFCPQKKNTHTHIIIHSGLCSIILTHATNVTHPFLYAALSPTGPQLVSSSLFVCGCCVSRVIVFVWPEY